MRIADLSLAQWRSLDLPAARRLARDAADQVGGRLAAVETIEHRGAPLHRVRIKRNQQDSALIPGGSVTLGFDLGA